MKKKTFFILLLVLSIKLHSVAQNNEVQSNKKTYLKLADYKKKFPNKKIVFTKGNYQVFNNDTLILVDNNPYLNLVSVPYEEKDSTFLEVYKDIVYKKYSSKKSASKHKEYMRLWKRPIKIHFANSLDSYYKEVISEAAIELSEKIDSLHISFVKEAKDANYTIYQIKNKNSIKYSSKIKNNSYINYYISWKRNKIYDTALEINLIKYNKISKEQHASNILKNFYETLGRFYSTNKLPCTSMFSNCFKKNKQLTEQDLELLKYHYSYGICKFTDLKTFEENHKNAKENLKKGYKAMFFHQY